MRSLFTFVTVTLIIGLAMGSAFAQLTEQEIVDSYLKNTVVKHTKRIGWASASLNINRINRHNDYNDFAISESKKLGSGTISPLEQNMAFALDFGIVIKKRFGWSLGGEYWMQMGETLQQDTYLPLSTGVPVLTSPSSEIKVVGGTTGLYYFLMNPPTPGKKLSKMAVRVGGTIGLYVASWDLWNDVENLNLSTSTTEVGNTTFKGSAPGFGLNLGIDYPLNIWNLGFGLDMSYLHLNFKNIAWYNNLDEEVIVSLNGTSAKRVDLGLSGVRGKLEIKRFFTW